MNTKILTFLILAFVTSSCASAQPEITGAPWRVTLKVVNANGLPVADAKASIGYTKNPLPGQIVRDSRDLSREITGLTDENGIFKASHTDVSWNLGIDIHKSGYYPTHVNYNLFLPGQFNSPKVKKNRNPAITVVLKKILHPIPMYAKGVLGGPRPPVFNKPVGYDMMAGDWVAPYGKGTNTDIIFTTQKTGNDYKFIVSFPNRDDGIQEYIAPEADKGSALRSPYEAPATGYGHRFVRDANNYNENRCYFFRIRTGSGENGPLYGKIYGDFMEFSYYLNPTPNSRNIEFNPKDDLIKHFKLVAERVSAP